MAIRIIEDWEDEDGAMSTYLALGLFNLFNASK
jgi:hypothetical protein